MALSFWLELQYFLGLKANVITSCCGSLFSGDAKTIAGEASGMEPKPALFLFYGALTAVIGGALWHWKKGAQHSGYLLAGASATAFVAAIIGVLSFISLYIYEHPHHHCPFCILKPEYDYQGYWLYLPLFVATAAGLGAGAVQPFARVASLHRIIPQVSARLAGLAASGYILFALVATYFVLTSNLILIEH
jgi:hypothetical protein